MKSSKIVRFLSLFLLTNCCHAQFIDSFSDGDFVGNPIWAGDNIKFTINSGKLKLQAPPLAETAFLSTTSQAIHDGSWEFYLQMDFNPSSSNYSKVYLVSDQSNLNGPLNGYFVKAGNTSRDVSLYRQNGNTETKIIDGLDDRINLSLVKLKIKVVRNADGMWQLFSDAGVTGIYSLEGMVTDKNFTTSSYFGVHCTYTSTRSDKFWFDDFVVSGTQTPDTTPPTILSVSTTSARQVNLVFSEPVDPVSAMSILNFSIKDFGKPESAILQSNQRTVQLNFSRSLVNGVSYTLEVVGVNDLSGNTVNPITLNVLYFIPVPVKNKDIIFSEIFPDPSPQIKLPNAEFVEILNRSEDAFDVSGWTLSDGSSTGILPAQIVLPGEYLIITAASSISLFTGLGKTIGLSNFPTLNNDGDRLTLKNSENLTVDSLNYTSDWYRDQDKQQGGWTLELIDPANPCGEEDNWISSEDVKGGTPGRQNSVFANKPDLTGPTLITVFPESTVEVTLTFDEKLGKEALSPENFRINSGIAISKTYFKDKSLRSIALELQQDLVVRNAYTLEVRNVRDCNGNLIQAKPSDSPTSFVNEGVLCDFGLPEKADSLDLVLNEILFNPRSGGVDFVELQNRSSKFLNLKNWKLANVNNGSPANINPLITGNRVLAPNGFLVLTIDPLVLKSQYPQTIERNLLKTNLPSLPDDNGSITIIDDAGTFIDALSYSREWHSEFIKNDEGVSLERISANAPTNDRNNWTSASSVSGFATPGFANSQRGQESKTPLGEVLVVPEIFSPQSGEHNYTQIEYSFDQGGWVANVSVLDQQSRLIKTIANNDTLGPEGFFRWEGDRDDGGRARLGYYVILFEVFNAEGFASTFCKRVVISGR